mmetsp:Transcript_6866/g.6167  ORF Transcript_6866/g.6167 Transcript_6866/m.6167 type:complete len:96 (+) Transcript_6866:24-311(+)
MSNKDCVYDSILSVDKSRKEYLDEIDNKANTQATYIKQKRVYSGISKFTASEPREPYYITGSLDMGTARAKANTDDALLHFLREQERLKTAKAPY